MTNVQPYTSLAYRETAICNECGATRMYRRARNHVYNDTVTWARETGDLKCSSCARITRHALITGHDYDEQYEARCRRRERSYDSAETRRLSALYRKNQITNPRLSHTWRRSDADAAYERGDTHVVTFCGAMAKLPKRGTAISLPVNQSQLPIANDDSLETFVTSWVEADCVDCEYIRNRAVRVNLRKKLAMLLTTALTEVLDEEQVHRYDAQLDGLISLLESVHGEGGDRR